MTVDDIFEKLFSHFNVLTVKDLSVVAEIPNSTLASLKARKSINGMKKKCRELGIYKQEEKIEINHVLLEKAKNKASTFGLNINSYLEHLIIQDLEKNMQ